MAQQVEERHDENNASKMLFTRDEIEKRKLNDRVRLLEKQIEVLEVELKQVLDENLFIKKVNQDQTNEINILQKALKNLEKQLKKNEINFIQEFDTKVSSLLKIIEFQEVQEKKKSVEIQVLKNTIEDQTKVMKNALKEHDTKAIQTEEIEHQIEHEQEEEQKMYKIKVDEAIAASIIELEENNFQDANATIQRIFDTLKSSSCLNNNNSDKEAPSPIRAQSHKVQTQSTSNREIPSPHGVQLKNTVLKRLNQARTSLSLSSSSAPLKTKQLLEVQSLHQTVKSPKSVTSSVVAASLKPFNSAVIGDTNAYANGTFLEKDHVDSILFMNNGRLISSEKKHRPMSPQAA